jgi:hypothetical protein
MAFSSFRLVLIACPRGRRFSSAQSLRSVCHVRKNAGKGLPRESENFDSVMVNRLSHFHQHLDFEPELNWHAECSSLVVTMRSRFCNLLLGTSVMFISLLEEVASFAAIFLFVTALAFWSNILSTI